MLYREYVLTEGVGKPLAIVNGVVCPLLTSGDVLAVMRITFVDLPLLTKNVLL